MGSRWSAALAQIAHAAGFIRIYLIGGALILVVGFVLYSQWILNRLEEDNRALVQPLARLTSYYPSIDDRETSRLVQEVVHHVTTLGRIQFVITDVEGAPLLSRGIDEDIDLKLRDDVPLTEEESARVRRVLARMQQADSEPIEIEYLSRDRRIIGRVCYGDVDPSVLAGIPLALIDIHGEPVAWRIYDDWQTPQTHPGSVRRAELFVQQAMRGGRSKGLQINPPARTGRFFYSLRPLPALQWMPVVHIILVGGFLAGGAMLYRRVRADEQAAIWAGLAKESAHQLGTPLTSLYGWLDLARETHPVSANDAVPDLYGEMHADLTRLQRIVSRFSQIGQTPTKSLVDVNEVVSVAAGYFRQRLPTRPARVEIEESSGEVPAVLANEDLLQWVVENLIRNALDAVEESGVPLGTIRLATDYDEGANCVTIRVQDNGTGMSRRIRRRAFAPGFSTKKRGWGVGLALAKRIVESYHGGSIRVVATDGTGTTFEIRLRGQAT